MQKYSKNCYNMAKYCHNRNSFDTDIQKNVSCPVNYIYPILCSLYGCTEKIRKNDCITSVLLPFRVRTRTQNKNSKECAYIHDNSYTLTRQINVHNSLRIGFEPIFQAFIGISSPPHRQPS